MKRLQAYLPALGIFGLALLVRLVYNFTVARGYHSEFDARYYDNIAQHLLSEHCFCIVPHVSTPDRAPFWAWIIAAIYAVTGPANVYARIFLSLLGSGTCVLIYLFTKDIFDRRSGVIAGVLAAVYTGLFIYDGWLYSESMYTFLFLVFAYALYLFQRDTRWRWVIISGLALAFSSLTRPNGMFVLGMVVVWAIIVIWKKLLPWQTVVKCVLAITLLTVGLIAPWTARNYQLTHVFIPVATGSAVVLSGAYNDTILTKQDSLGMWTSAEFIRPPVPQSAHRSFEGEDEGRAYAVHWIVTHLSSMPYLLSLHFINMWKPYTSEDGLPVREFPTRISSKVVWAMMQYMPILVIFLAACGFLVTLRVYHRAMSRLLWQYALPCAH